MSRWLQENKVSIWDEWADEEGDLGPVYGKQWRHWETPDGREIDQIAEPDRADQARPRLAPPDRHRLEPGEIDRMALPPCHCLFQTQVAGGRLILQLYQRSADVFLGVPFNIASYALADPHARPAMRARARRLRLDRRRLPSLLQPSRPGPRAARPRAAAAADADPAPPPDRRSTNIASRISRSAATIRTRTSRPRWRFEPDRHPGRIVVARADNGVIGRTAACPGTSPPTSGISRRSPWARR